jgi:hypothetical protein
VEGDGSEVSSAYENSPGNMSWKLVEGWGIDTWMESGDIVAGATSTECSDEEAGWVGGDGDALLAFPLPFPSERMVCVLPARLLGT